MSKFLFIRNDDVCVLDNHFREFFDFMFKHKIPVVYGVIPAQLQKDTAVFLRRAKEKDPKLLDIVQHGFAHCNYAEEGQEKYEFGPRRSYAQQYRDIARGMRIMRRWFGELTTPGFIPPYHSDDPATIEAIETLNVPLYSARLKVPRRKKKFLDVPAQIWDYKVSGRGKPWMLDFNCLSRDLKIVLKSRLITGMVFHHPVMVSSRDKYMLTALMKLVVEQRAQRKIRTVLFSDLLNAAGGEKDDQ